MFVVARNMLEKSFGGAGRTRLHILTGILSAGVFLLTGNVSAQETSVTLGGEWAFMNGTPDPGSEFLGKYGIKGTPSESNRPGIREKECTWTDNHGNTYLFGGLGYGSASYGLLNDFWRYDNTTHQWTWLAGSNEINAHGQYGTLGVAAASNFPGARYGASTWLDTSGTLWMFGGSGYAKDDGTTLPGMLNDLWKFEPQSGLWTWVNGSSGLDEPIVRGTIGVPDAANTPGARTEGTSWIDAGGNLWLFGGLQGLPFAPFIKINDMWKFEPGAGMWTLVHYGANGNGLQNLVPETRTDSATWVDPAGRLVLYGGWNDSMNDTFADLWQFDPATSKWTQHVPSGALNSPPIYGTKGTESYYAWPGSRHGSTTWVDPSGNLWMFGGNWTSYNSGPYNDLWRLNPVSLRWTWMAGANQPRDPGAHGNVGQSDPAYSPGARYDMVSWLSTTGTLCLRGGRGITPEGWGYFTDDAWSFDTSTNQWEWLGGDYGVPPPIPGNYGTKGVPDPANEPPARLGAAQWIDAAGNFWMYGGRKSLPPLSERVDDLWKFNPETNQWTWVDGDLPSTSTAAVSGELGIPSPSNTPGRRQWPLSWIDAAGDLWLFGTPDNAMWKYEISSGNWARMTTGTATGVGVYGTLNVPADGNTPGARADACSWKDEQGNFWLFGGFGKDNTSQSKYLDDLWSFNPVTLQWTWMGGNVTGNGSGTYGVQGVPDAANWPAARMAAVSWHVDNKLWLYGGNTRRVPGGGWQNDLWVLNLDTGVWTWMDGKDTAYALPVYGEAGVEADANTPGARESASAWVDAKGDLWLFGGDIMGKQVNDLWRYKIASGKWSWMGGSTYQNPSGSVFGQPGVSSASYTPGARSEMSLWKTSDGSIWIFGGFGFGSVDGYPWELNDMWRLSPSQNTNAVEWQKARLFE